MRRATLIARAGALALALLGPAAGAGAQPRGERGFHDVLPPGANGRTGLLDLAAFLATGRRPAHSDDQLAMYRRLLAVPPRAPAADVGALFKDAALGAAPAGLSAPRAPIAGLQITRDRAFGVPHVRGATRAATIFGLGYVAAEDRLFLMDALRHAGRAQLSSFAGGAPGNRAMDAGQWAVAPYTEEDLQRQLDALDDLYGDEGRRLRDDVAHYVAGINRHIEELRLDVTRLPVEYAALGRPGPRPWRATDVVATASLIGARLGRGGGDELTQMELRRMFRGRYGARRGERLWREWAAYEDADAPTTVRRTRFPYQRPPRRPRRGAHAIADPGSLRRSPVVVAGADAAAARRASRRGLPWPPRRGREGLLARALRGGGGSNALLVAREQSASGRPLAVFGPQTGYLAPQILLEQDVRGPGIDARGAAFPGISLYVLLGHGPDYAWSATSAGQDIVDTFALELCEPDGRTPTSASMHYRFRGACEPIEVLERTNSWAPTLADATPAGAHTLRAERTRLGLIAGRATIAGRPVAYARLRSTYMHEIDSGRGVADLNDPARIPDARAFQRAAHKIGFTFNWLYVDERDIAYFNSGTNPRRARGVTGQLPAPARLEWRGFDPARNSSATTPFGAHPQAIGGQPFMTSWNNKQARGYASADTSLHASVFRSQLLDDAIRARIAGPRRIDLGGLVAAMGEAATVDLRAARVLPLALRAIGTPREPRLAEAVRRLRDWIADGGHRRDADGDGRYEHADAIRILDAFWPRWLRAQFEPSLGPALFERLAAAHALDDDPNGDGAHVGSAYQTGWYGRAAKDLRAVVGLRVRAPYGRRYCGGGRRARCAAALRGALARALGADPARLYRDELCAEAGRAGEQACFDAIAFRSVGAIGQPPIPWQNRPTYQQAVEVQGHRPR